VVRPGRGAARVPPHEDYRRACRGQIMIYPERAVVLMSGLAAPSRWWMSAAGTAGSGMEPA
jgi:hypothetical protein